jgi:hypothetical protein
LCKDKPYTSHTRELLRPHALGEDGVYHGGILIFYSFTSNKGATRARKAINVAERQECKVQVFAAFSFKYHGWRVGMAGGHSSV